MGDMIPITIPVTDDTSDRRNGCYCPSDCNCHSTWKPNYCGCTNHPTRKP